MSHSTLFLSVFFFFISSASSSSFDSIPKCSNEQSDALLMFKQNLSSINFSIGDPLDGDTPCQDWLGSGYHPIMKNWNRSSDCCNWGGVSCDHLTGDVIGLDLSCGMLQGTIFPDSTLFRLPHLQTLNLAYNHLNGSSFIAEVGRFPSSLSHLNISDCRFTGQIPPEISFFWNLVSIDLSLNYGLQMEAYVMNNLLQNSSHLRELLMDDVNTSGWVLPTYLNLSSSLRSLHLSGTGLQGKLPVNIFDLPYLEQLDLSDNFEVTGPLPEVNRSIPLKFLDLSYTNLSAGEIPDSIGHLKSLYHLDLSFCSLVGSLPKSLVNLTHLTTLSLSKNMLNGTLPPLLFTLPSIEIIQLHNNMFSGGLPSEFFNCPPLKVLTLQFNQFDGEINLPNSSTPPSFINLTHLHLSSNKFRGLWDLDTLLSSVPNLIQLGLYYSGLSVVTNNATPNYVNPHLLDLSLASCKLNVFPESLRAMPNLQELDVSNNDIHGHIPDWAGEIGGNGSLRYLNLSQNSITDLPPFQWDGLRSLYMQSNRIQGPFPPSICNMSNLVYLDMSNNSFAGVIPQCVENIHSLEYLDMSYNIFAGVIPQCVGNLIHSLRSLNIKSNMFEGPFPPSICNMSNLEYLDLSNNNFAGVIPHCVRNFSSVLIDLGNNRFHGTIPDTWEDCGWLEGLILKNNRLEGELPRSLSKCQYLKVVDLGNNNLNGTFPGFLGDLPNLQVLNLKANSFHGSIETSSAIQLQFSSLRVLDLSHNGFVGHLPLKHFENSIAMKNAVKNVTTPTYMDMGGAYYSVVVAVKGTELEFPQISVDYIIVDLSYNRFESEIPDMVGNLSSLIVLNLSHNNLTGPIPDSLGNLSEIESLDLSWNQLTGQIPQSLENMRFLAFLNLSQNHLVGRIPQGKQFDTFQGNSFGGNSGLCGLQLPQKCEHPHEQQPIPLEDEDEDEDEEESSDFTWKMVKLGCGSGTIIGMAMGYIMLSTGRPRWFNAIADAGDDMIQRRQKNRRYVV